MATERGCYYIFDTEAADKPGVQWRVSWYTCPECLYEYVAVHRLDLPDPTCPRCVASDRWVEKGAHGSS